MAFYKIAYIEMKKECIKALFLHLAERRGFGACAPFSDKQWVTTIYPTGNLKTNFLPIRILSPFTKTKNSIRLDAISCLAERRGFEPPIRFRIPAFQASTLDHSDTSPRVWSANYNILFQLFLQLKFNYFFIF